MSHARKMLTRIENELENLSLSEQSYSIGQRSLVRQRLDELTKLRNYYKAELKREELKQEIKQGKNSLSLENRFTNESY